MCSYSLVVHCQVASLSFDLTSSRHPNANEGNQLSWTFSLITEKQDRNLPSPSKRREELSVSMAEHYFLGVYSAPSGSVWSQCRLGTTQVSLLHCTHFVLPVKEQSVSCLSPDYSVLYDSFRSLLLDFGYLWIVFHSTLSPKGRQDDAARILTIRTVQYWTYVRHFLRDKVWEYKNWEIFCAAKQFLPSRSIAKDFPGRVFGVTNTSQTRHVKN